VQHSWAEYMELAYNISIKFFIDANNISLDTIILYILKFLTLVFS